MNTLTALTLSATLTTGLMSTAVTADEITQQLHTELQHSLVVLRQSTQQQARLALHKTAIALQAQQVAEQDAAVVLVQHRPEPTADTAE